MANPNARVALQIGEMIYCFTEAELVSAQVDMRSQLWDCTTPKRPDRAWTLEGNRTYQITLTLVGTGSAVMSANAPVQNRIYAVTAPETPLLGE